MTANIPIHCDNFLKEVFQSCLGTEDEELDCQSIFENLKLELRCQKQSSFLLQNSATQTLTKTENNLFITCLNNLSEFQPLDLH